MATNNNQPGKRMMRSFLLFVSASLVLLMYLVAINRGIDAHLSLFWLPIISMIAIPLYQISRLRNNGSRNEERIILIEIFLMTLSFRLIFVVPFASGLRELDPHYDFAATKIIMEHGYLYSSSSLTSQVRQYLQWPMLHLLAASTSEIAGADLFALATWFAIIISPVTLIFVYLFAKTIYDDTRSALLAAYGFSGLYMYINWDSKFVRETLATTLFWATLYVCLRIARTSRQRDREGFRLLAPALMLSLVFAHHLTSLMLILFAVIAIAVVTVFRKLPLLPRLFRVDLKTRQARYISLSLLAFICILTFSQWMFVGQWLMAQFKDMAISLVSNSLGKVYAYNTMSPRMSVSFYGNLAFLFIGGIVVLYHILRDRCNNAMDDLILSSWSIFILAACFAFIFVEAFANFLDVARLQMFGWPFILIIVAHATISHKKRNLISAVFAVFLILQILTIPPHLYNRSTMPEYDYGRVRGYYLPEEYAAVAWFPSSKNVIGDLATNEILGGLRQIEVEEIGNYLKDNHLELPNDHLLFYRNEDSFSTLLKSPYLVKGNVEIHSQDLDRVLNRLYDNGEVTIYGIFLQSSVDIYEQH